MAAKALEEKSSGGVHEDPFPAEETPEDLSAAIERTLSRPPPSSQLEAARKERAHLHLLGTALKASSDKTPETSAERAEAVLGRVVPRLTLLDAAEEKLSRQETTVAALERQLEAATERASYNHFPCLMVEAHEREKQLQVRRRGPQFSAFLHNG